MRWAVVLCAGLCAGCGDATSERVEPFDPAVATQVTPVVTRIAPVTGRSGDLMTIFGAGFSVVPEDNIVILSNTVALAASYAATAAGTPGEVEQLTFTIPSNTTIGTHAVTVNVYEHTSNGNVTLTVTP